MVTSDSSILVQGNNVNTKLRRGNELRSLSNLSPIIVYSSGEIIIEEKGESYIFPGIKNFTSDEVVFSALTEKDVKALESAFWWQNFWRSFSTSDWVDIILIIFQIITMPFTIVSFIFGYQFHHLKDKRKLRSKRDIYAYNQQMLKYRRSSRSPQSPNRK